MLVVSRRRISDVLVERLRFHEKTNIDALKGVLYLPEALLLSNLPKQEIRDIPLITLPIRKEEVYCLPGAPTAIHGYASVHKDTREISGQCTNFSKSIRDEVKGYFSSKGEGKSIRSFASFRIGGQKEPVGVLNIDSDQRNVLGPEPEYYITFKALVEPFLRVLAPAVVKYATFEMQNLENNKGGSLE